LREGPRALAKTLALALVIVRHVKVSLTLLFSFSFYFRTRLVGVSLIGLLFLLSYLIVLLVLRALAEGGYIVDLDLGYLGQISIRVNNKDNNTNLNKGV
jgi:hypothetical protein